MKTTYVPITGAPEVATDSIFKVGQVTDKSGFKFPENAEEPIDLQQAMNDALQKALTERGAYGADNSNWTVSVDIVSYAPGNAFARWLMPGAGATKLSVVAYISDETGLQAAKIPVERSIGFGGAYTIGAWKYVFDEVAKEIADTLIDPKKRNQ
ncbi:MAG: DUF4410 domain-containing protein [Deltaproteobacteria bacterium]|nr:DUF4410 domain-containing protein [Deltaproteobacteria bacterium]